MTNNSYVLIEKQLVLFSLGEEVYGVDIAVVHEIIRMQPITKVPKTPHFVEGVINLRGKVIPVVNMRKRFNLEAIEETMNNRIVVVNISEENVGVIVDAVIEVLRIPADSIESPSDIITTADSDFLMGIANINGKLITLLDLARLLSKSELSSIANVPSVGNDQRGEKATLEPALARSQKR
jgi:purine-binding chemotaxis protein CheW